MSPEEQIHRYGGLLDPHELALGLPDRFEVARAAAEIKRKNLAATRKRDPATQPSAPQSHGRHDRRRAGVTVR